MTDEIIDSEKVEQLVNLTKELSDAKALNEKYQADLNDSLKEIEKYKSDIVRLQKIISDNFIASKEVKQPEISTPKTFNDVYKEMIINNSK